LKQLGCSIGESDVQFFLREEVPLEDLKIYHHIPLKYVSFNRRKFILLEVGEVV